MQFTSVKNTFKAGHQVPFYLLASSVESASNGEKIALKNCSTKSSSQQKQTFEKIGEEEEADRRRKQESSHRKPLALGGWKEGKSQS